jgi:hypothetical protein
VVLVAFITGAFKFIPVFKIVSSPEFVKKLVPPPVALIVQVVVQVAPEDRVIPEPAVMVVTVPEPPPPPPEIHAPFMLKHPPVKLIPFAKVDDAEVEVIFRSPPFIPLLNVVVALVEKVFVSESKVEEAEEPPVAVRVEPSKVSPEPIITDLIAEAPLPARIPPRLVVEAVPPLATGRAVPEYDTASVPDVVIGEPETERKEGTDIATEVTVPLPVPVPTQTPLIEKHPPVRLIPFAKVEDAVVEVVFKYLV